DENSIHGYVDATVNAYKAQITINQLTVAPDHRRRGLGSQLIRAGLNWAREQNLKTILAIASTKNYPTTALLQKQGFIFSGFNDHYYTNRDIALFFALTIR